MSRPRSPRPLRMVAATAPVLEWLRDRGLLYFRRARVVCCDHFGSVEAGAAVLLEVGDASDEDIDLLASAQGAARSDWVARRARGSLCFVARSGAGPLGCVWLTRSAEAMSEVNHVLDVSNDARGAYLFDGYVLPEHRGKGVLRVLLRRCQGWAAEGGISRLYAAFARENRVSEHALRRAGFVTLVGDVAVLRVLGREWKWVRIPPGSPWAQVLGSSAPSHPAPRAT